MREGPRKNAIPAAVGIGLSFCAGFAVLILLVFSSGCAPNEEMVRLEGEMDRLNEEVTQLKQAARANQNGIRRANAIIDDQLATLQREQAATRAGTESMTDRFAALETRMDEIESNLSVLTQKIDYLSRSMQRMQQPEIPGDAGTNPPESGAEQQGVRAGTSPQELYRTAFADYRRGNFELAIIGFKALLEEAPDNPHAGDAQYYLGECYYANGNFEQAIRAYDKVIHDHPQSAHIRSAYLKKGYAYMESNQLALGVVQLYHVIDNFPGTAEANLAKQKLESKGLGGRP